jgi:aldose 1-epimerase
MAQITDFGKTAAGELVQKITLSNDTLTVSVLTYGAILQSVRLAGVAYDLTLGADNMTDYQGEMCYFGSLIAPVVNRLTNAAAGDARFEKNFLGKHSLHSGSAGAQHKVWTLARSSAVDAVLTLDLPHGEGGFAGARQISATFTLTGATLRLDVAVVSDRDTIWNTANHSYWNLDGSDTFAGHQLQIMADSYLPTDVEFIPTGEIRAVEGTDFDFRSPREIAPKSPPLDNSFCLSDTAGPLREVLVLRGMSGVTMRIATTEAGIQVYDCRQTMQDGRPEFGGVAIEAQNWPDAPNHAGFPSIDLAAGETRVQTTQWHFAKP